MKRGLAPGCSLACAVSLCSLLLPGPGRAHDLKVSYIPPSVRAGAMGRAGVALPADDPFVAFLNPALLPHARGIHWGHSRTRLVPNFATDVFLEADYITLGVSGIGLEFSGRPFSALGGTRLDYGTGIITRPDENGGSDSVETFRSFEDLREFAFSADVLHTVHGLLELSGNRLPDPSNYFDVSLGMRWKRYQIYFPIVFGLGPPDSVETPRGTARDWGALVRLTPYHNVTGDFRNGAVQTGGKWNAIGGLGIDVLAGVSMLNSAADPVRVPFLESVTAPPRFRRLGLGARLSTGMPRKLQESDFGDIPRAARYLGPTAALSFGYDAIQKRDSIYGNARFTTAHAFGAELTILGVVSGRLGHYRDAQGGLNGTTGGFGVRLHYSDAFSLSYEWASLPQAEGPARLHPHAWQMLMNPYGVLKLVLGG